MKKTLFDCKHCDEVAERVDALKEETSAYWGTLTPTEMMRHCTDALKSTLTPQKTTTSSVKQRLTRLAVLYLLPKFPKYARTPAKLDVKSRKLKDLQFAAEKAALQEQLVIFKNFSGAPIATHPYFGNLSRKDWGVITWMHLDHHLRQFGV